MPCPDQKEDAKTLLINFLEDKKIYYMYNAKKDYNKETFYDDLERNVSDLAARGLVELVLDRVQKNSDGIGLRACSLALLPYFLNRTGIVTKLTWLTHGCNLIKQVKTSTPSTLRTSCLTLSTTSGVTRGLRLVCSDMCCTDTQVTQSFQPGQLLSGLLSDQIAERALKIVC